jgi:hypothetical protein
MEIIGLMVMCFLLGGIGLIAGVIFMLLPKLRRFALAVTIVPASTYFFLIMLSWYELDKAPICGPDPEWDRCPSHFVRISIWAAMLAEVVLLTIACFYLEKVITLA